MREPIAIASVMLALAACAQPTESIAPANMGNVFQSVPCADASRMYQSERATLATLDRAQDAAVAGDALGVFLLGVPTSSLTGGDQEGQIAATKGKMLALEARLASCRGRN